MEILLRADSHYACPEVLDWCEANGLDYILGLAPTSTLKRHVGGLEASTSARFKADPTAGKVRRFKEFHDAAGSWSRVRRIVARVEAGGDGTDTRFIVTNLGHGNGRSLYQDLYCRRGQAENHIKAWKSHLAADRTSCPKATANQFRLFLHAGAYWLLWSLRALMPRASSWRVAQFDTLRLRPDQDRRPHRRDENQDQGSSAKQRARSSGLAPRPRPPAAPGHLNAGAVRPYQARSPQPPAPLRPADPPHRCGGK